jgi:GH24 family phage-related lysozyme (muramidase)
LQRQFQAGDWYLACRAFEAWKKAGGQVVQGIINRNVDRMRVCFTNLPPERTLAAKFAP